MGSVNLGQEAEQRKNLIEARAVHKFEENLGGSTGHKAADKSQQSGHTITSHPEGCNCRIIMRGDHNLHEETDDQKHGVMVFDVRLSSSWQTERKHQKHKG